MQIPGGRGGNLIAFIDFVLETVQQYDLHVIRGPARLVWR